LVPSVQVGSISEPGDDSVLLLQLTEKTRNGTNHK